MECAARIATSEQAHELKSTPQDVLLDSSRLFRVAVTGYGGLVPLRAAFSALLALRLNTRHTRRELFVNKREADIAVCSKLY